MDLFTPEIEAQLLDNGRRQSLLLGTENDVDFYPVVKLFTPDAACTWLLTEIDPDDPTSPLAFVIWVWDFLKSAA